MSSEFLNTKQAAEYTRAKFHIGNDKTYKKMRTVGGGPVFRKCGPKLVLYTKDDLDKWCLSRLSAPLTSTSDNNGWVGK
jgi:hypothetical protein